MPHRQRKRAGTSHWWCPACSACHIRHSWCPPFSAGLVSFCLPPCLPSCLSLCPPCLHSFFVSGLVSLLVGHCVRLVSLLLLLSPFCFLLSPFLSSFLLIIVSVLSPFCYLLSPFLLVIVSALSSWSPFFSGLVSLLVGHCVRLISLLFPFVALVEPFSPNRFTCEGFLLLLKGCMLGPDDFEFVSGLVFLAA